jgi:hypothetical protein
MFGRCAVVVQLEEWWETFAYLQPRYPIAVNINWHGVMPGTWGTLPVTQAEAAAMFTRHILGFRESLVRYGNWCLNKLATVSLLDYRVGFPQTNPAS